MEDASVPSTPKRATSLRHNRTTSDIQTKSEQRANSNGLRAVNTVTGAIQTFLKWSASPLLKEYVLCFKSFSSFNLSWNNRSFIYNVLT